MSSLNTTRVVDAQHGHVRIEPAPAQTACVALLDDMTDAEGERSRLYDAHVRTLSITDPAALPALLDHTQQSLAEGLHAVGLFTYELGAALQSVATRPAEGVLAQVLLFNRCRRLGDAQVADWLRARLHDEGADADAGVADVRESVTDAEFAAAVQSIRGLIAAGDTYQVNYTYRVDFDAYGPPAALYARLRQRQRVPYGALVLLPDGDAVLSLSPELFVRHAAGRLLAQPMKGTARAGDDDTQNRRTAQALAADAKNRSENLMIVDLLRNDLGRVAKTGSVSVPSLFDVGRFGDVLQMTSTVCADLQDGATLADIFQAVFPCGSVTGAPKRRSMQIIHALEPQARGLYTGGIAWFDAPARGAAVGDFCMSVPIRTLTLQGPDRGVRRGRMGVGAGIVADSDPAAELAECRLKARFLTGLPPDFELIETMHATRDAGCRHLPRHLARLAASARYFGFALDVAALADAIENLTAGLEAPGEHRVRLALRPDGRWSLQHAPQPRLAEPVQVFIDDTPIDSQDVFLRHKSSVRARLDAAWRAADARGGFDTLLFNERAELAQGGRTNVFVKLDGRWFAPPLASGALPGVMRSVLLEDPAWGASERVLTREDLDRCEALVVCNALRGALRATLRSGSAA